jgi:hypothetical protein
MITTRVASVAGDVLCNDRIDMDRRQLGRWCSVVASGHCATSGSAFTTALSLFGILVREFDQQRHAVVRRHLNGETV